MVQGCIVFVNYHFCNCEQLHQPGVCVDRPVVCRGGKDPRHVVGSRPCFVRFVRYSWIIGIEASLECPWHCYWFFCGSLELNPLFMVSGDVLRLINWQIIYWLPVGFSFNLLFWSENPVTEEETLENPRICWCGGHKAIHRFWNGYDVENVTDDLFSMELSYGVN